MNDKKSEGGKTRDGVVVIKKYANRRLYNTATSAYVTLEDLAQMVREGVEFVVYDAKTNDELTRQTLTQIIFEEENRGEALLPVLAREIPLKAHAHQANDIFTALRIAREFDLRLTLEHVTEGHLIADELAKEKDVPMAVGPSLTFASKFELQNKSWKTPGVLANAGCHVSIITDNSLIPQQYLPLCAGMAVKAGMDPFDALKAITINPAEHIGVADRVGSLEVGKDADVVITNGCPFEVMTEVRAVFIDGVQVAE